jgi:hypothetical protein
MYTLLKGCRFVSRKAVRGYDDSPTLYRLQEKGVQEHFQQWYSHLHKCETTEGNYF